MTDSDFGKRLKMLRIERDLTLREIAERADLSTSFISQIETGGTQPSIPSLKRIVGALGITVGELFEDSDNSQVTDTAGGKTELEDAAERAVEDESSVRVVRRDHRKTLSWPSGASSSLLTPDLRGRLEVLLTTYDPTCETMGHDYAHDGEELGFVLRGHMELTVDGNAYELGPGDSIYYPSHLTHWGRAIGDQEAETIWIITPPSF